MTETIHLIAATEERHWTRWLEPVPHDFYHTAAYHTFSAESGEGQAFLAVYGSRDRYLAWPYLLRSVGEDSGLRDVTSVYGYSGPLALGCQPGDAFLRRACARIRELWVSQNVITAFTRFHPVLENQCWIVGSDFGLSGALKAAGETVSIDLQLGEAANWHDYHASLRNRINRGRRMGLVTEIDTSWNHVGDFARLYQATMRRNHASPRYFFTEDYFRRLKCALGPHAFLLVARLRDQIAAAAILTEYDGIVQNHFCMNNEAHLALAPSKVLLDDARRWARARGNRVFHLGGGRGGARDSLFSFKAGFSDRRHPFSTGRWILEPGAYDRLCRRSPLAAGDFFPAYRATLEVPPVRSAMMIARG